MWRPSRLTAAWITLGALLLAPAASAQIAVSNQDRLWDAAIAGDTLGIAEAIGAGAAIDSLDTRRNPNGRRALNWAAWYDRMAAVRLLVARGAAVNLANRTGNTPLHHAAENGAIEAARALLAAGADPFRRNGEGQTPTEVARSRGHERVAALLEAAQVRALQ